MYLLVCLCLIPSVITAAPNIKTFYIALKHDPIRVQILENLILDHLSNPKSPDYGRYLSSDHINTILEYDYGDRMEIIKYLSNFDIKCADLYDALKCSGSIMAINTVFDTDLKIYYEPISAKRHIISYRSYKIPDNNIFKRSIEFIDGLSNNILPNNRFKKSFNIFESDSRADRGSVSREVMMRMYNIYPTFTNSNVSVGAMEYMGNDGFSNKHLIDGQIENGVPANPITPNHIIGAVENPDEESELDVQVMYWAVSDAELWYEVSSNWMYGWAIDFFNRKNIPEVVSISWGWSETDQCTITICPNRTSQSYVQRVNVEFMKIVARGTTIVVSSGDAGSPGRTNEVCFSYKNEYGWNHINAIFPGGSPWVLSVGATYVTTGDAKFRYTTPLCTNNSYINCTSGMREEMTNWNQTGWTSGAGFTHWDKTPKWQQQEVQTYLNNVKIKPDTQYFNPTGRAYPDVSAFGHNCPVKLSTGWHNVDGTSCSSPIFAGIIANLNSFQKSRGRPILGFVNPVLYDMYRKDATTFNDITYGFSGCTEAQCCNDQYGFYASAGWDVVSGLGTPNIERMKLYLSEYN